METSNKREDRDKHARESRKTTQAESTHEAPVASPEMNRVSDRAFEVTGPRLSAKELKERISFSRLLESDGHKVLNGGKNKKCRCPFHDDRTPSFVIYEDDSSAKCYGCGWYGDIFTYVMESANLDFYKAFQRLKGQAASLKRTAPKSLPLRSTQAAKKGLTSAQIEVQKEASLFLADDFGRCKRVASKRAWKAETIQRLAKEGSLGWNRGALAFLYDTGMKLRNWPDREFGWEFGGPCVWRRQKLEGASQVFLCEGETDAISLVDAGLEEDPDVVVVALASATSITGDLTDLLKGKHVTICMDNDPPGESAKEKLIELLEPVCASVSTFNYGEVASDE